MHVGIIVGKRVGALDGNLEGAVGESEQKETYFIF